MTRGDYLIHVFIEQGRQMKCPENRTVDPMIECSVLGEKKYSSIKKGITHATTMISWNEHLFFEPRNVVRNVFFYMRNSRRRTWRRREYPSVYSIMGISKKA